MSTYRRSALILSALTLALAASCSSAPPNTDASSMATADSAETRSDSVTRAEWLQTLPQSMAEEFCASDNDNRGCYPKSDEICSLRVQQVTVHCAIQHRSQIPSRLQSSTGEVWGGKIADCANEGLLASAEAASSECQQALGGSQAGSVAE